MTSEQSSRCEYACTHNPEWYVWSLKLFAGNVSLHVHRGLLDTRHLLSKTHVCRITVFPM
jgi:hypothetical protein